MSAEVREIFGDDPYVTEAEAFYASQNGTSVDEPERRPWNSESWETFRDTSNEETRWLIDGLLPEGQLVFTAAPPKKGKTWLALAKALCLATGRPLFGEYQVPEPVPTLYVALEGSRPALRARIGCIARGVGIDPDNDIPYLRMLYRPRPFDLAELAQAAWLRQEVHELGARYVVIDVLRQAARIKEQDPADFAKVRDSLEDLLVDGVTVDLLHHFGKLNDTQKERTPGERMSGSGAMYGALDVGFYITRSENGARRLRLELEARDFATPEAIGVVLEGNGTGEHGGFRYVDTATMRIDESAAEERDVVLELEDLFKDGAWRTVKECAQKEGGIGADQGVVRTALEGAPERFAQVTGEDAIRAGRKSKSAKAWGTLTMLSKVISDPKSPKSPDLFEGASPTAEVVVVLPTGEHPPAPPPLRRGEGDFPAPNHHEQQNDDIPF